MNKLLNLLHEKADSFLALELPDAYEYQFLDEFLSLYNAHDISTYENVGFVGYLGVILLTNNINMSFEGVYDSLEKIKLALENKDFDFNNYTSYLDALKKLNDLDMLVDICPQSPLLDRSHKLEYQKHNLVKFDKKLFTYPDERYDECASTAMIKLFKSLPDPEKFTAFLELLEIEVCVDDTIGSFNEEFSDLKGGRNISRMLSKEKGKVVKLIVREYVQNNGLKIYEYYDRVVKRRDALKTIIEGVIRDANKKISRLATLDRKVSTMHKNEMVTLGSNNEKLLIDSDVEYRYLMFGLQHNLDIFSPVEEKNKEYNNNSITKMEILFSKYGYNFNMFSDNMQEEIIGKNIEEVEGVLKQIKYSDLGFITDSSYLFYDVIMFSNPQIVKFLDTCLKNKFITKDFILLNNKLLYDLDLFARFFNNFNYLTSLGVDMNVKGIENVLLLDSEFLVKQLNILSEYKINVGESNFSNVDILKNSKILDILDNFIELGYGRTIFENPKYLTDDSSETIKRIMIAQLIGMPIVNSQKKFIGPITTGNNFYIGPKEYDKFIIDYKSDYQNPKALEALNNADRTTINASTKNIPIIKELDQHFMLDSSCYEINGVLISRKRVMRNLEVLIKNRKLAGISLHDLLFQAILYNMIPNIETDKLNQIYNTICSIEIGFSKIHTLN